MIVWWYDNITSQKTIIKKTDNNFNRIHLRVKQAGRAYLRFYSVILVTLCCTKGLQFVTCGAGVSIWMWWLCGTVYFGLGLKHRLWGRTEGGRWFTAGLWFGGELVGPGEEVKVGASRLSSGAGGAVWRGRRAGGASAWQGDRETGGGSQTQRQ